MAHLSQRPTVLIASRDRATAIPFDIRLNRVVLYEEPLSSRFEERLATSMSFLHEFISNGRMLTVEDHLRGLGASDPQAVLELMIRQIGHELRLDHPRRNYEAARWRQSHTVHLSDNKGRMAWFEIDVNGFVRSKTDLPVAVLSP